MVRLKGEMGSATPEGLDPFQFHYGTIKSMNNNNWIGPALRFQFHYGTIKSCLLSFPCLLIFKFQFHYGTIKRVPHLRDEVCSSDISIPLWYD